MATAFCRQGNRLVATFEPEELAAVVHILRLTRDFVAPPAAGSTGAIGGGEGGGDTDAEPAHAGDAFDDLVAGLGSLGEGEQPVEPEDPALARLLPLASKTDFDQATEFRRLTEAGLRSRKAANLSTAINALAAAEPPTVEIDLDQARALTIGLTDARLVLGERLGVRSDEDTERLHADLAAAMDGEIEIDPATVQSMAYYDFLSWLQESVTAALLRT